MNWKYLPAAVALSLGLSSSASAFDVVERRQNMIFPTQGYLTEVTTYTLRTEEGDTLASIARRLVRERLVGQRVLTVYDGVECREEPGWDRICFDRSKELQGVYAQLQHWNPHVTTPSQIPVGTMITYKAAKSTPVFTNIM